MIKGNFFIILLGFFLLCCFGSKLPAGSFVETPPSKPTNPCFIDRLTNLFQNKKGEYITPTTQYIYDKNTQAHFYGIHRNEQKVNGSLALTEKRYRKMKSSLLTQMGLALNTPIIEIVGDSAPYSVEGTDKAYRFLDQNLSKNSVWIYGYTGHQKDSGAKCINAVVSHLAEKRVHLDKTIGSLVGFHTPFALTTWGCKGPHLNHYILVYGDDETSPKTGTVFGDDIITSDFLSDQLLLVEGGIQSFHQACHFLLLQRPILGIDNLREENKLFSATGFLQFLKEHVTNCPVAISEELLNCWYDSYLKTHILANSKNEYKKQEQLDEIWSLFKKNKLYQRLTLFSLYESDSQKNVTRAS